MDSRIQHTLCVSKAARLAAFFVFGFLVHSTYRNPMFDHQLRPIIDRPLNAVARLLARWGIGADQITWAGFAMGMAGAGSVAFELYLLGLVLILASRAADGLDGAVARATGSASDRGGFLDIVLDFLFYSAIPFAFAVAAPDQNALAAAFLIWSFIGTGTSFLGYAVIAEKRGINTEARGRKSLFYLGGLTEGAETILFLCLICLWPQLFAVMAWVFATLAWITTATRIYMGWADFKD